MHRLSCSSECGIFPDQWLNPCPLRWQVDSQTVDQQGGVLYQFFFLRFFSCGPFFKSLLNFYNIVSALCLPVFLAMRHVGSYPNSDQTCTPCIGRQSLNLWTTREVPPYQFSEPVLQTVLPRTRNCQWFQEEPADSSEALAKLAQVSRAFCSHFPAKPVLSNLRLDVHPGMTPNLCTTVFFFL